MNSEYFTIKQVKLHLNHGISLDEGCRQAIIYCASERTDVVLETLHSTFEIKYKDVFDSLNMIADKTV